MRCQSSLVCMRMLLWLAPLLVHGLQRFVSRKVDVPQRRIIPSRAGLTLPERSATASLQILAAQALAMLASSEEEAEVFARHAQANRPIVQDVLDEFDVDHSGQLNATEAERLFTVLAMEMLRKAAQEGKGAAAAQARVLLSHEQDDEDEASERLASAVSEISRHLLRIADKDLDGSISLDDLAELFEGRLYAQKGDSDVESSDTSDEDPPTEFHTSPSKLDVYELRGLLQLLPRLTQYYEGAAMETAAWHDNVAGDSHTLLRWVAPTHNRDGLSIVGLGRSADASCYYLPEWGLVLDAGLSTKAFRPKAILLTHGHKDHTHALPVLAQPAPFPGVDQDKGLKPKVLLPADLEPLVRNFLHSAAVLNIGRPQSIAETDAAIGRPNLQAVRGGDVIRLPRNCHTGKDGLSVEVFNASHKGMPAVSFGIFLEKKKLKPEFAQQRHRIAELLREKPDLVVSEYVRDRILFYSGDTTIDLLERNASEVLQYRYIIHECTFCGPPSTVLDHFAAERGHTHYAALHKFICAAPDTVFILVHFSLKYSKEDILAFFNAQYGGVPRNVVLWI